MISVYLLLDYIPSIYLSVLASAISPPCFVIVLNC